MDMRVVTVSQNKGGDGKSKLSQLLGDWGGRLGLRVLMIDMDPQANLSQRFLAMDHDVNDPDGVRPPIHPEYEPSEAWDGRSSVADLFNGRSARYGVYPYPTWIEHVDMLPSHGGSLREVEMVSSADLKEKVINQLRQFMCELREGRMYDLVLIDTPPSKGPLVRSAVRAATHMIIPAQMEQNSVEGLQGMLQLWRRENRERQSGDQLAMIGILPSKYRRNVGLQVGIYEGLRKQPFVAPYLIPHVLSLRAPFAETDHPLAVPRSVFDLPRSNSARKEAEAACGYIFASLGAKQSTKHIAGASE